MLDERLARAQHNAWSCGPAALRHGLLCLGRRVAARRLARMSGCTRRRAPGDEGLRRAAAELGCRLGHEVHASEAPVRRSLRAHLAGGAPVLLCVDRDSDGPWAHWIVAVGATARHVTICDSARPGPVVRRMTWRAFLDRACMYHLGEKRFDLYPLSPA